MTDEQYETTQAEALLRLSRALDRREHANQCVEKLQQKYEVISSALREGLLKIEDKRVTCLYIDPGINFRSGQKKEFIIIPSNEVVIQALSEQTKAWDEWKQANDRCKDLKVRAPLDVEDTPTASDPSDHNM